jgi:hypothetical protein
VSRPEDLSVIEAMYDVMATLIDEVDEVKFLLRQMLAELQKEKK